MKAVFAAALALAGCYDYGDASGDGSATLTGSYDGFDLAAVQHAYAKTCSSHVHGGIAITLTTNDCRHLGSPGDDDIYVIAVVFDGTAGSDGSSTAPSVPGTFTQADDDIAFDLLGPIAGGSAEITSAVAVTLEDIEADDITGAIHVSTTDPTARIDGNFTTSSCTNAPQPGDDGCTNDRDD